MDKALALRPASNVSNVALPSKNASPIYLAASDAILRTFVAAGLPSTEAGCPIVRRSGYRSD